MLQSIWEFIQAHPMVTVALVLILYRIYSIFTMKEEVVEGSRVVLVESESELETELKENKIVVIDFFANWCPGCVRSAPEFARMSKIYNNVRFIKVNTDNSRAIASEYAIEALPTFKVITNKKEVASIVGFDKSIIISKLEAVGGVSNKE
jgi:thioredoxin 1